MRRRPFFPRAPVGARSLAACGGPWGLALSTLLAGSDASAQRLSPPRFAATRTAGAPFSPALTRAATPGPTFAPLFSRDSLDDGGGSPLALGVGSVAGGLALGAIGAFLGYHVSDQDTPSEDGLDRAFGAAVGFLLFEPVGMGVGANVANRGRGAVGLDVLGAAGAGFLSTAMAWSSTSPRGALAVGLVAQVAATVAIERVTARARERRAP